MELAFEWNHKKADADYRKHGVTFEEATGVFTDPLSVTIHDPLHSDEEDRFVTVGISSKGRLLVVVHMDRKHAIRLISARSTTRREKRDYEEKS